jgi:hypothetical protein
MFARIASPCALIPEYDAVDVREFCILRTVAFQSVFLFLISKHPDIPRSPVALQPFNDT